MGGCEGLVQGSDDLSNGGGKGEKGTGDTCEDGEGQEEGGRASENSTAGCTSAEGKWTWEAAKAWCKAVMS